jgi:hypothetical protein
VSQAAGRPPHLRRRDTCPVLDSAAPPQAGKRLGRAPAPLAKHRGSVWKPYARQRTRGGAEKLPATG